MKAHVIESGVIVNTIEIDRLDAVPGLTLVEATEGTRGWTWDGANLSPPARNIVSEQAALIRKIDTDVDELYALAIGNRGPEYEVAAAEATAFKAAGYLGTVPDSVQSWSDAKGWTKVQAADDILAAAQSLKAAQKAIRANRLARKEDARKATIGGDLDSCILQWSTFHSFIKSQLGV